jgi:hypothetical protein
MLISLFVSKLTSNSMSCHEAGYIEHILKPECLWIKNVLNNLITTN